MASRPTRDPRVPSSLPGLRLSGAVPLDPKPQAPPAPNGGATAAAPARGGAAPGAATIVEVTEATFATEVLQRSEQVPVVIDFWADWCGPCKQLSPILERLAAADGGSWVLAKIDVDANPGLAQAAGVQGIPAVKAVVGGRVIGEFTGALPEREVRGWIDQLLALVGSAPGAPGAPGDPNGAAEPPPDPDLDRADEALGRGDLTAAEEAYRAKLASAPADREAVLGLARVQLMRRLETIDEADLRRRLAADPDDVDATLSAADLAVAGGAVDEALASLVSLVRRTTGSDRDRVRAHLVDLFTVLSEEDPAVPPARRALAAALF